MWDTHYLKQESYKMQNHNKHIQGEKDRIQILQYMTGKSISAVELREKLNMTKYQIDHHIRALLANKYIKREKLNGGKFLYKRTRQTYTPKQIKAVAEVKEKSNLLIEDLIDVMPTLPHARVIRLLKNPLPPAPKSKYRSGHMYSGIQSGMGMFDGY